MVDLGELLGTHGSERAGVPDEPRLILEADVPWLVDLCKRRYSNRYDAMSSEAWFRNIVLKGPLMFGPFRTEDAFVICMLAVTPWLPGETECNICFACADDGAMWQLMALLRFSIDWARKRNCATWRLTSDTAFDLGPLALRLGAKEITPRYILPL